MDLLDQWTGRSGGAGLPFITYYDLGSGERTELSGTTTGNWVAKASSLLVDELDAEPGTRVWMGLPSHWLRAVWILAAWNVGAVLVDGEADIAIAGPDLAAPPARHRLASALRPFGLPFATPPAEFVDIGAALPGQPDVFVPFDRPSEDGPALDVGGRRQGRAELLAAVDSSAERLIFPPGPLERDLEAVLAAAVGGGSLVFVTGGSADDHDTVARQEHARMG